MRQQIGFNHSDLARHCGVSPQTVIRHVDAGVIPRGEVQVGKRRFFTTAQVETIAQFYVERHKGETLGKYKYDNFNTETQR